MTNTELYILVPVLVLMIVAFIMAQLNKDKQNSQGTTKITKNHKSFFSKKGNTEDYNYLSNHFLNVTIGAVIMLLIFFFSK